MSQEPERHSNAAAPYLPWAVSTALALVVLAGTVFYAARFVREKAREQIQRQDAEILYQLWRSAKFNEGEDLALALNERISDQLPAVLETLRLPQLAGVVLGTRVFDADGQFRYADPNVSEATLPRGQLDELRHLKYVAWFRPSADLSEINFLVSRDSPVTGPLLEVSIPLYAMPGQGLNPQTYPGDASKAGPLVGIAQFILDGSIVAGEFKRLDRTLWLQGSITFAIGAGLLVIILGLGFRQLERMNALLVDRTQSLLRANQELALAAKTAAVGAVTAHLIHGLKNPLSGLQTFMATRGGGSDDETDWELAVSSTRRMQTMIGEIVRVLRDEEASSQYELSLEEFCGMLRAKTAPLAQAAGVHLELSSSAEGTLRNREANILNLVLYNLIQNAVQAAAKDKAVSVTFSTAANRVIATVRDEGPGFSSEAQANLFKPCRSSKEGGSGIGLAISKQLANCIGAELELKETGPGGSIFILAFPLARTDEKNSLATEKISG